MGNTTEGGQEVSMEEFRQEQQKNQERIDRERRAVQEKIRVQNQFSASHNGGMEAPSHIAYQQGNVFPLPQGALGPFPTRGPGVQYIGGSGGNGLPSSVNRVRFMDETHYHPKRVVYMNNNQTVSPTTGKPVGRSNPEAHLNPFTSNY
jgi:hypothetical protein